MPKQKSSLAAAFKGSLGRSNTNEGTSKAQTIDLPDSQDSVNHGTLETVNTIGKVEMVPGGKGKQVPAELPVNMTFTVTAKERYLWNLELSKRGLTGVSVLRRAMNALSNDETL